MSLLSYLNDIKKHFNFLEYGRFGDNGRYKWPLAVTDMGFETPPAVTGMGFETALAVTGMGFETLLAVTGGHFSDRNGW